MVRIRGPWGIATEMRTANLKLSEGTATTLYLQDITGVAWRDLALSVLSFEALTSIAAAGDLRSYAGAASELTIRSYDGAAYQLGAKLVGGNIAIHRLRVWESLLLDNAYFIDDFMGDSLDAKWTDNAESGSLALLDNRNGGVLGIVTGAGGGDSHSVDWNDIRVFQQSKNPMFECRAKEVDAAGMEIHVGLWRDANNYIGWFGRQGENFYAHSYDAGAPEITDSGVAVDTSWHRFSFIVSATDVKFYLDGTLEATHTAEIPSGYLQPRLFVLSTPAVAKTLEVDYVLVQQDR